MGMADNLNSITPSASLPPSSAVPVSQGVPLNQGAAQTALKTNALAGKILTWMTVASAVLAGGFFFATIFVSLSFSVYYAISMVATIAFGFASECVAPRNLQPQQPRTRAVGGGFPPLNLPGGQGGLLGWIQPVDPLFVEGQPVQLTNDGSSCFIDACFQEIMLCPPMKQALVGSCQAWNQRFEALDKVMTWFKSHDEAFRPTPADIRLIISFLSSDLGGGLYDYIKKHAEQGSLSLKFLYQHATSFRNARHRREKDPEIPAEDEAFILSLFDFESHWTDKNIDTYIHLYQGMEKKKAPPEVDALEELMPLMSQPEDELTYDALFGQLASDTKAPKWLKDFDGKVHEFLEVNKKSREESDSDAQNTAEVSFFSHFLTVAHFVKMGQDLLSKSFGIQGFLKAVQKYHETSIAHEHRTGITLTDLRSLLPEDMRQGQQDANDMFRSLMNLVDQRNYPDVFFQMAIGQRFVPYDPQKAPSDKAAYELKRLEEYMLDKNEIDLLPLGNEKLQRAELSYELYAPIPSHAASWGQELFDALFEFHPGIDHDPIIYLNPETQEPSLYTIDEERFQVDRLPDYFVFTLKRFERDRYGRSLKNHQPVVMPEFIHREKEIFEVVGIIVHRGREIHGGHYITLSKSGGIWWVCDDMGPKWNHKYVYQADDKQMKQALTYGYQYLLKKCDQEAPILKDWPPKDLPSAIAPPPPPPPKISKKTAENSAAFIQS